VNGIDPSGESLLSYYTAVQALAWTLAIKITLAAPAVMFAVEILVIIIELAFLGIDLLPDDYQNPNHGTKAPVQDYEVGEYNDLRRRIAANNQKGIYEVHHAPQKAIAGRVIKGYNQGTAPSIVLRKATGEHAAITRAQNTKILDRFAKDPAAGKLLSRDLHHVRNYTQAPIQQLKRLSRMMKGKYPHVFRFLRRRGR